MKLGYAFLIAIIILGFVILSPIFIAFSLLTRRRAKLDVDASDGIVFPC